MYARLIGRKLAGSALTLVFVVVFNFFRFRVINDDPVGSLFRGSRVPQARLDQLRAVDSRTPAVTMVDPRSGPMSTVWTKIRDLGKGGVADLLQDPDIIEMMGKTGPLQTIIAQTLLSMSREVTDKKRPVEITVGP